MMRIFGLGSAVPHNNPFAGAQGAALYVSPPDANGPADIVYREPRVLMCGLAIVADAWPAPGDGPLGLGSHVAITKEDGVDLLPDEIQWTIPGQYLATAFWVNVRPHLGGLELDTISGAHQIQITGSGAADNSINGVGRILSTTKLDDGGLRVWTEYAPASSGVDPETMTLTTAEDNDIVDTVAFARGRRDYTFELSDLDDGETYTLEFYGVDAADAETLLDSLVITADAAGPPAVTLSTSVDD